MTMWLVGMMGSGKTRAGRIAASHIGVGFADTDEQVERSAGLPVALIWRTHGEQEFRRLEREALAGLAGFEGIVATGGGVILDEDNRRVMASGTVVWLQASPGALTDRVVGGEGRPLLEKGGPGDTLQNLLDAREALYREIADHEIDTDGLAVQEVAERIETLWSG